jgi:large subunit ribosomal protein L16
MLQPKRTKFRKAMTGRMTGKAYRGGDVSFGDFGCRRSSRVDLSARQIEAARMSDPAQDQAPGQALHPHLPDKPVTKKPQETRHG